MAVVKGWSRNQAVAIFKQGQENLARKHEKEGIVVSRCVSIIFVIVVIDRLAVCAHTSFCFTHFSANDCSLAARLKVSDLTLLAVQMWSHIMLLPHAQVSGGDHDSNMSLERRLQTLLGAVSSHWPSFEPMLHRVANRIGSTMQQSHAVGVPLDQGQMSLQTSMGLVRDRPPEAYRPHELSGGRTPVPGAAVSLPETLQEVQPSEKGRRHGSSSASS